MRRGVQAGAVSRGVQDRGEHRRGRALAVRPRDDDRAVRALRPPQRAQQRAHPPEAGANAAALQRVEPLHGAHAVRPYRLKNLSSRPIVPFSSARGVMASTKPFSTRNSERWKPSGRVWRMVCSITRGPAKPMSAFGSAMLMSPSIAYDAVTPPVVGSVRIEMYGSPAAARRESAAEILAICMSDRIPSCMRAPPEVETMRSGSFFSTARSASRAFFPPAPAPPPPPREVYLNPPTTS